MDTDTHSKISSVLIVLSVLALLAISIAFMTGMVNVKGTSKAVSVKSNPSSPSPPQQDKEIVQIPSSIPVLQVETYITPKLFTLNKVGAPPKTFANLCPSNHVLYPINGLGPDYGGEELSMSCPCLEFTKAE
jgi:hypothetical protein